MIRWPMFRNESNRPWSVRNPRRKHVPLEETVFHKLPNELIICVMRHLSISAMFQLCSTSKSVRRLLFPTIGTVIRLEILDPSGGWRWLLPVKSVPGESERALESLSTWLGDASEEYKDARSIFASACFPHLQFLRACSISDSMRNRQRLFGISQQYEHLWLTYRTGGFVVDPMKRKWRLHNR